MKCPTCKHDIKLKSDEYITTDTFNSEDEDCHTNDYRMRCEKCGTYFMVSHEVGTYPY